LGIYIAISILAVFLADPELVKERSRIRPGTKALDMVVASVSFIFFFPFALLIAGLDVGRFGWSPSFSVGVQLVAIVVFARGARSGEGLRASQTP